MANVPKRVNERIKKGARKYKKILEKAKIQDLNESDTVTIVNDILSDVFGYDKYGEITSEFAIRGTFCDLAVKHKDKIVYLIECKAIGVDLKEQHFNQAVAYAANEGIEWVVLTNGMAWLAYRVIFGKPVKTEKVFDIDFSSLDPKEDIEKLFVLTKEALSKSAIEELHQETQLMSKFSIAAVLQTEETVNCVARQLKRSGKGVKIDKDLVGMVVKEEVLKRDVTEGEEAKKATSRIKRASKKRSGSKRQRVKTKELDAQDFNAKSSHQDSISGEDDFVSN